MPRKILIGFFLITILILTGASCSRSQVSLLPSKGNLSQEIYFPLITASPQPVKDGKVIIDSVSTDRDVWLVIHKEDNKEPEKGEVVGYVPLSEGNHKNIEVKVNLPPESTLVLIAILHIDAGKEGIFEFPGEDIPVISPIASRSDVPVMMPFPVISEAAQKEVDQWMKNNQ